jgi:hypothetical protein
MISRQLKFKTMNLFYTRLKAIKIAFINKVLEDKISAVLLFCCFSINSYSQTSSVWIQKCFKEYKIKEHSVLTFNFDDTECSKTYVAVDSMNRTFIFNDCKNKIELDTFFQQKGHSFNKNGNVIIGVNKRFYYILYGEILNLHYKPVIIEKDKFDSLEYLQSGNFIGYKGTEKWILDIDNIKSDLNNYKKINFIGSQFFIFNGGLIAPIELNNTVKFRYIQFSDRLTYDTLTGDNLPDPNYKYLQPDMKFEADSILIYPDDFHETALIKNNGILQIYSFCKDTVIESIIEKYYQAPIYDYPIIITKSHVSYGGCEWKKLAIKNVISIEFEDYGDLLYGFARTNTNEIYKIDFWEGTFSKK